MIYTNLDGQESLMLLPSFTEIGPLVPEKNFKVCAMNRPGDHLGHVT